MLYTTNFLNFPLNSSMIKNMPPNAFWLLLGCLVFFMLMFGYRCYQSFIKARTIEDTPTAKIRSTAQGYVELQGEQHAFNGSPVIAPLTKTPCTWYYYEIGQISGKKSRVTLETGISSHFFELQDTTGRCIIDPKEAQVSTKCFDSWYGFKRFPSGKPKTWLGFLVGRLGQYYYQEWRMEPGMPLYALGNFHTIYVKNQSENSSLIADKIIEQQQQWRTVFLSLLTPFLSQAEQRSKQEWQAILHQTHQTMAQQSSIPEISQALNILSGEGLTKRTPYLLSTLSQVKLIQRYKIDALFWLFGYLLLLLLTSTLLLCRF